MLLAVAGFYMAMQIYKAVAEERESDLLIEVDPAGEIKESETAKALARAEAEAIASEAAYGEQLEKLKAMDLLDDLDEPAK
jgi:hypothetical protein